jgi:phosphonate transport system permease protein
LYESIRSFQYGDPAAQIINLVLTFMLLDVIDAWIRKALLWFGGLAI